MQMVSPRKRQVPQRGPQWLSSSWDWHDSAQCTTGSFKVFLSSLWVFLLVMLITQCVVLIHGN